MGLVREEDIEKYLVKRVAEAGGEIRKVRYIGRRDCPDRIVMFPGSRLIWVELKKPGEKPRSGQLREHKRLREAGQRVEVVDTFEGVDGLLL